MGTVSKLYVSNNTWIYVHIKRNLTKFQLQFQLQLLRVSTPIPTPTPASLLNINFNSNSNSGSFNFNSNSNKSLMNINSNSNSGGFNSNSNSNSRVDPNPDLDAFQTSSTHFYCDYQISDRIYCLIPVIRVHKICLFCLICGACFKKCQAHFLKFYVKMQGFIHKLCTNGTQINEMPRKIKFGGHFSLFIHVYEIYF